MNELSPLDATFLELEQADRSAHMHIGGMLVFDPLPDGGAPPLEIVRTRLEERLGALPRYRQRLSRPQAGPLRWPHWEEDPTFDLDAHVRRAALPAPGGDRELLEWAGDFFSHRLDRGLPLWKAVILEGLRGGRWAVVTKTHTVSSTASARSTREPSCSTIRLPCPRPPRRPTRATVW